MKQYFEIWKPGKSYCEVDGRCEINGSYVRATLNTGRYSIVQIRSEITDVIPDTLYRFDYVLKADKGISHRLLYRFYDKTGAHLYSGNIGRGVIFFAPKDAYKLEVTVFLYSYYGGTADFFGCGIESLKETETRKLKLAAISGVYPGEDHGGVFEHTLEKNVENAARMLDATAAEGADLALLTETYNILYVKGITPYEGSAEFDDPAVQVLADKAKQHHMFVAAGVCFKNMGLIYNAQLIFDPHGELVGLYSKSHTTEGDLANGYVPGNDIPVFDTEIGRLGTSICWDIYFPEHARVMYMKEAEIILHSTESTNPLQLADTAESNSVFIAVAQSCKRSRDIVKTRIIDRNGKDLDNATTERPFACAEIDLTSPHPFFWANGDQRSSCMGSRRPDLYKLLADENIGFQAEAPLVYTTAGNKYR